MAVGPGSALGHEPLLIKVVPIQLWVRICSIETESALCIRLERRVIVRSFAQEGGAIATFGTLSRVNALRWGEARHLCSD